MSSVMDNNRTIDLPARSNSIEQFFAVSVPQTEDTVVEALLARLVHRSSIPEGFDRQTLLRLDSEAWGVDED